MYERLSSPRILDDTRTLERLKNSALKPDSPRADRRTAGAAPGGLTVIPGSFAYHRPTSVKDALSLLADLGDEARAIAGGHSLIPMMKLRLATPSHLVDLAGVADLKGIRIEDADIVICARPRC